MRRTGLVVSILVALILGPAVLAQETMNGTVATVDTTAGKIGIRFGGTDGAGAGTTPTEFKIRDGLVLNAVKPGDRVSFVAERAKGAMMITQITKE